MKFIFLSFMLILGVPAMAHPASQFVFRALSDGRQILETKSGTDRRDSMCQLFTESFATQEIATAWLGDFAGLNRDQAAIDRFPSRVPSLLISRFFGDLNGPGQALPGEFEVKDDVSKRADGTLEVTILVRPNGNSVYEGRALVKEVNGRYLVTDGEAMGQSAREYFGREYLDFLQQKYDEDIMDSMPVTALLQKIETDPNYFACP